MTWLALPYATQQLLGVGAALLAGFAAGVLFGTRATRRA